MSFGNGIPLSDMRDDAVKLSAAAFASKHGEHFLLIHGLDIGSGALGKPGKTFAHASTGAAMVGGAAFVFKLERKETSTFPFIAVGRNEKNDIWLPHASVSRFHCYFKTRDGGLVLQDAKSANGTRLNDEAVPLQGEGEPVAVSGGASIRIGDVIASYLPVDAVQRTIASQLG